MDFSALQHSSKIGDEWRYPPANARSEGLLQVAHAPDHHLYWEEYGNPAGEPVVVLHGGPGGACSPAMARYFDPARYRVILFDQRGCGKSSPMVAADGPAAALIQHQAPQILARVNMFLGSGAVAKLRIVQGKVASAHLAPQSPRKGRLKNQPLDAAAEAELRQGLAAAPDSALARSLLKLGREVMRRRASD